MEMTESGFQGTIVRTFDGEMSGINVIAICSSKQELIRHYSISKLNGRVNS
jgi:hypothetical protein